MYGEYLFPQLMTSVFHYTFIPPFPSKQCRGEDAGQQTMKMLSGLELLSYEDRMRELVMLHLQKRRLWGECIAPPSVSERAYGEGFLQVFLVIRQGVTTLN